MPGYSCSRCHRGGEPGIDTFPSLQRYRAARCSSTRSSFSICQTALVTRLTMAIVMTMPAGRGPS